MKCALLNDDDSGAGPYSIDRQITGRLEDIKLDMESLEQKVGDILDDLGEIVPEIRHVDLPIIVLALECLSKWNENPQAYLTPSGYEEIITTKEKIQLEHGVEFPDRGYVKGLLEDLNMAMMEADLGEDIADDGEVEDEETTLEVVAEEENITDAEIVDDTTVTAI